MRKADPHFEFNCMVLGNKDSTFEKLICQEEYSILKFNFTASIMKLSSASIWQLTLAKALEL